MKEKKYPVYYYLLALLLPLLFFVLLELGLRLGGYAPPIAQWIHPSPHFPDYIVLNQDITKKYFHQISARPSPTYDGFFETKQPGSFRVFVMGGSTTAGFPYTINGSFARYIRHFLETAFADKPVEVINLGISAVNSYTVRDLLPGVIEKEPDLLILYMGHNEYYGALGIGSVEYLGRFRSLVNLMISLEDYRTIKLLRNLIGSMLGRFSQPPPSQKDETLMARLVGEKLIPLNSDVYNAGLSQFEGNMSDILEMLRQYQVPVIISTLTANIKDQPPFESLPASDLPPAADVFAEAERNYARGAYAEAGQLYLQASDLDALRFRAPQDMNRIVHSLAEQYDIPVVFMDQVFNQKSTHGIPGRNLFTDHVHPTLAGYRLMGFAIIEMMRQKALLPRPLSNAQAAEIHRLAAKKMTLTRLDSIVADLRIRKLKGGWPFLKGSVQNLALQNFRPADTIEELSLAMVTKQVNWEEAHLKAAIWYRDQGRVDEFVREMQAILENIPLNPSPFKILIDGLIANQRIDTAFPYLLELDKRFPDAYSKKWLGTYFLYKKNYGQALDFLQQSREYNERDAQLWYNLAGAYLHLADYPASLQAIQKCLVLDPDFPGARRMEQDLIRIVKK